MNLFVFQRTAVTEQGNVIPNAEITVYAAGTTTEVDLFDDAAGTAKLNPFNAGPTGGEADGFIQFYVSFGNYDIAVNGTVLWENETIGRPELSDITALSSLNTAALVADQAFRVVSTGRAGDFVWRPGDQKANCDIDPMQGVWVKPDGQDGSSGAFERIFDGQPYGEWFGAVGDEVADDGPAINAGLNWLLASGRRGSLLLGRGDFLTRETIFITGLAVGLVGLAGERATRIIGDFSGGPIVKQEDRFSVFYGIELDSTAARKSSGIPDQGHRVESIDSPNLRPTHVLVWKVTVRNQPGIGSLWIGGCWQSFMHQCRIYDNLGGAVVFDSGHSFGVTNTDNPGQVSIDDLICYSNGGHGLQIGNDNNVSNRGFRFDIRNYDGYYNATNPSFRKSASDTWLFLDSSEIHNSAFDGSDNGDNTNPVKEGLRIGGKSVTISNSRFLYVTRCARIENPVAVYQTEGITFDKPLVFSQSGPLSPAFSIASDANKRITFNIQTWFNIGAVVSNTDPAPQRKWIDIVRKTTPESVSASTTLQNDDALFAELMAEGIYQFRAMLIYRGPEAADIKLAFSAPAGATVRYSPASPYIIGPAGTQAESAVSFTAGSTILAGTAPTNNSRLIEIVGEVKTNGTAGNLQLQWAQNTSDAGSTQILDGSFLTLYRY